MNQRAAMKKEETLGKRKAQLLAQRIKTSIKKDCKLRTRQMGKAAVATLEAGNPREARRIVQAWHREAGGYAAKPCYSTVEKQMEGREDLHGYTSSPGENILANRDRAHLQNEAPSDEEIRMVVKTLRKDRWGAAQHEGGGPQALTGADVGQGGGGA